MYEHMWMTKTMSFRSTQVLRPAMGSCSFPVQLVAFGGGGGAAAAFCVGRAEADEADADGVNVALSGGNTVNVPVIFAVHRASAQPPTCTMLDDVGDIMAHE